MRELSAEAEALWRTVEVALTGRSARATGVSPRVMAQLAKLADLAPVGSAAWSYAHRELAAHLVMDDPWRASAYARKSLAEGDGDAMAWGILGLAQTMLGNYPYAIRAYREALRFDPQNPWYAHNLGHLLDVVEERPGESIPLLESALAQLSQWPQATRQHRLEMEASLAHALLGAGHLAEAHARMRSVMQSGAANKGHHDLYDRIREALETWVDQRVEAQDSPDGGRRVRRRMATAGTPGGDEGTADPSASDAD